MQGFDSRKIKTYKRRQGKKLRNKEGDRFRGRKKEREIDPGL